VLPLRLNSINGIPQTLTETLAADTSSLPASTFLATELQNNRSGPVEFHTNHDFSYPMMLQRDNHSSCLTEFSIGSEKIVGFTVGELQIKLINSSFPGGEPRLCLPQLKALIMPECNGVDKLMSDLQITTVNASNDQLHQLVQANALPKSVSHCPLITRSNAERLVNYCVIRGVRPLYGVGDVDNFLDPALKERLREEGVQVTSLSNILAATFITQILRPFYNIRIT
jgi:hypothetical protein